jgi:hypothetical protein
MSLYSVLAAVIVLAVCAYFGVLRPTGIASRTSAQREEDRRRDLVETLLDKVDGKK